MPINFKLTLRDTLRLSFPFFWGIVSVLAAIIYAGFGRIGPTLFSLFSLLICIILFVDIFQFHRQHDYSALEMDNKQPQHVTLKLIFAVFLTVVCAILTLIFVVYRDNFTLADYADPAWSALVSILALVWCIDILVYHLNTKGTSNLPELKNDNRSSKNDDIQLE